MEETVVYIAGPMAGLPDHNFPAFEVAATHLRRFDLSVLSPHEDVPIADLEKAIEMGHDYKHTKEYRAFLLRDLAMVAKADVLVLLPGWEGSGGCCTEVAFAQAAHIHVISFAEMMDLLHGVEQ